MDTDWQCDLTTTKERQTQLLQRGIFTDITFLVGKELKPLKAHKLILSASSSVFAKMFYGKNDFIILMSDNVTVADVEPEIFSKMLQYIYAETICLESGENALKLHSVAQKYLLNGLGIHCFDYLVNELKPLNALNLRKLARIYENKVAEEEALKLIKEQTITVLDIESLADIDIADFMVILEQKELQTTEHELFLALNSLAVAKGVINKKTDQDNKMKSKSLEDFRFAAKKIQFNSMTLEQFLNGPLLSNFLLPAEKIAICACLNKPTLMKELYPKDFAQNLRQFKNLPQVFFDIKADRSSIGRIVVQLRSDVVPKTVEKFLSYCHAENLKSFKGSKFHFINNDCCKVGLLDDKFSNIASENHTLKNRDFATVGVLYNASNYESVCSGFMIDFSNRVDDKRVFVGHVVKGMDVVKAIASFGTEHAVPSKEVLIEYCGTLKM